MSVYQLVVDSEERHLTRFVEQVGEGDEGFGLLQVEDEHGGDERHALDLKTRTRPEPDQVRKPERKPEDQI